MIRVAELYKEITLSNQDGTTDNSSPTPHRMWNFRMAQYTMTVYTSTHSPALGAFKSIIETKNTETGNINLLPVSKHSALHIYTKGTSCQAKTEALIIHHPHLTACGTFTWLSTRWLSTRQGTRKLWDHKYKLSKRKAKASLDAILEHSHSYTYTHA